MSHTYAVLALLICMLFIAKTADSFIEKYTCRYCGELVGHDEFCPYNGVL